MTSLLVLDTNVVLDLLVFADPSTHALRHALLNREVTWLSSAAMKAELIRVLEYPRVAPRLSVNGLSAALVLAEFDQLCQLVEPAPAASCRCADADDQHFVDLAVHHGALLVSKDAAVLALRRSMRALGARVDCAWPSAA